MRSGRWRAARALAIVLALSAAAATGCSKKAPQPPKDKYAGLNASQVFEVAQRQMESHRYGRARETLQKALGRSDITPDLTARIHLALADAYFHDGGLINLAEALSRYTNFLTFYPNHERADYVQYQLGLCYLKQALHPDRDQGQTRKALSELSKVEREYPGSSYIALAGQKAAEARERLADHDFRIGYFYFRRGSWQGAIDRFRNALEQHPNYSHLDRLYLVLGQSLIAVNRGDEGRLYLEKLVAEYPSSRYAIVARGILASGPAPPSRAAGTPP
jgi:outer membrane protein assembly factor BamD